MANPLDEVTGPYNDEGREVRVIEKQLPVTIGAESVIFEIFIFLIGFVIAGVLTIFLRAALGPIGLVIGNEGEGVGRLVKEKCDMVASIPMKGDIDSLNASVAAGVLAYEIVRQRLQ